MLTRHQSRGILFHVRTLFLFTYSDFKTMTIPQSMFAVSALLAPKSASCVTTFEEEGTHMAEHLLKRVPVMVAWLWFTCLAHNIANQSLPGASLEDAVNKPWRPIPARRISSERARSWLLVIIASALCISYLLDAVLPLTLLLVFVWMYNDLDGSGINIWVRNALNMCGLMCFGWSALSVLAGGQQQLLPRTYAWLLVTGTIVMTTVHAQDLPDVEGDRIRGRKTMPLVYGERIARLSVTLAVCFWSLAGPSFWVSPMTIPGLVVCAAPAVLGLTLGLLAMAEWGPWWDRRVLQLWCAWLLAVYASPLVATWVQD